MKLLTATNLTQGYRDNDFDFCVEGELVHLDPPCAKDRDDPDGPCGCGRSFGGLNSHLATTTVLIRDVAGFTAEDYVEAIRSSLDQQGYDSSQAVHEAATLYCLAQYWPAGTVLERRLDQVAARAVIGQPQ
ncbi:MAG TPA: hypothetical protein VF070_34280 [Streptosporangiaceae bacterium]